MPVAIPWIGENMLPEDLEALSRRIVCVAQ